MNIIAFAASNSKQSINKQLVRHATTLLSDASVEVLDLNDFEMPIYSIDREQADGIPAAATELFAKIGAADALVISYAEHNGSYSAAYKNIFDWMSRINQKVFQNKAMVLLSASPGKGGGANVLKQATESAPYFGGEVKASLSIPAFGQSFDAATSTLTDAALQQQLQAALSGLAS